MRWLGRRDRDCREELEAHIEIEVRENLERGMAPGEARAAALRTFGNALAVREGLADARPLHFWHDLYRDIWYGLRLLRRSPGLTATVVITLALGIGANTAIFSFVNAVLLRTLPVRDPRSLVIVRALTRQGKRDWFSHTDYEWLRDHNRAFSQLAATASWRLTLDAGDHKERVGVELVSGNYFSMLGVDPAAGRMIAMDDDRQNRPVAVISYGYWQRAFGGGSEALGKELHVEKAALEIIGVARRGFHGEYDGDPPDFWIPLAAQPAISKPGGSLLKTRNASWLGLVGRLRPGLNATQAQAGMQPLLEALRADLHVDAQNDYLGRIGIEPGGGGLSTLRDQYAQALRVLMALVAVVLLIACANVANLLLARSAARGREFAVRLAIGAGRARLVRQLLTESFLLAAMACAAGLAIGNGMVRALLAVSDVKGLDVHMNLVDPKNIEIVGVVKDAKYDNLRQETPRLVYLPIRQEGPGPNSVQIRATSGGRPLDTLIRDCRAAIRGVNANIRIVSFEPLAASVNRTLAPDRLVSWLSAGFGILALLLTSVGLYGILAYAVARRTSEFGIRMALGAGRAAILQMVMKEGLVLVGIGLMVGLAAAVSLSHLVASLLFGVQPDDSLTFALAAVTLAIVASVASYVPARRATAVEPLTALRYE